jgi:peptidoglycan lytic transglycosylase G
MTRHRRHDPDEVDGDAPWRAPGYDRPPETGGDYHAAPWSGPAAGAPRSARGALGTSSGRDDRPGEATGPPWERTAPPWEQPGWDEAIPPQRRPRGDSAHPSGPLPRVNSGPQPRVPGESGPPTISGPLPPVPREPWPAERSRYPDAHRESSFPGHGDTGYLRTGSGFGGADSGSGEYPAHGYDEPGYDEHGYDEPGYGDSFPARGGRARGGYGPRGGDYATPGYDEDAGYDTGAGYAGEQECPGEHGYAGYPGPDYPEPGYAGQGYAGDDYPGQDGYADEPGYQDGYPPGPDDGYPGQGTGYQPADDYRPGLSQSMPHDGRYGPPLREDTGDRGYGDRGGWYGDVDEDQAAWVDEEDGDGLLPGFSDDEGDFRRARGRGPGLERAARDRGGRRPQQASRAASRPRSGPPKRKSAMRRAAPWIALTVLVVVLGMAGGGFLYVWNKYLHPPDYSGPGTGTVKVQIKSGETATQVGQELLDQGVVASVRAFSNAAKASGKGSSLEPGYYLLHKHMSAALAFALLLKPSSRVQLHITIPEGLRLSSIITVLGKNTGDQHGYQQAIKDTSALGLPSYAKGNPEGYLFPATYTVQPGTQPIEVLRAMVLRFSQEASSVSLPSVTAHDQISESDAITVASLVQAEGRRPQDFPKIARVIYNRLNAGMPLQLDSTVMYALHTYGIRATAAQTKVNSPYNTYQHVGLPPGPIDSPGDVAIRAALHPAKGTWLYFLTVNPKTGLTKFTDSFSVFQTYEAQLNANLAKH